MPLKLKALCDVPRILAAASTTAVIAAGCASPEPKAPVQPVSIKADSFCPVMRRLNPPDGIPTWDTTDTNKTIEYVRRVEAAVVKNCLRTRSSPKPKTS